MGHLENKKKKENPKPILTSHSLSLKTNQNLKKKIVNFSKYLITTDGDRKPKYLISRRRMTSKSTSHPKQRKSFCSMEDILDSVPLHKNLDLVLLRHNNNQRTNDNIDDSFTLRFQLPDLRKPIAKFVKTREAGEFLSGALAGAMTKAVLAPLETIRTRMVVGVGSKTISGSFLQVIESQGWQGLWAGNAINMIRIVPTQAIELGTFEYVKRVMTTAKEKWSQEECPNVQIGPVKLSFSLSWLSPVAVGGAAAGIAGTLVCHPLEVLKDRLTVSPDAYPNLSIAVQKMYKNGGIGSFYSGLSPTLMGMLPYSTCYYFMYDTIKKSYCTAQNKKTLSRPEMLLIGALSGLTASTISFPLEVARKRLMVGALHGKCPPNIAAALSEVIRDEGFGGLYRGWGASCLKVMPSSGITWMFYEAWKDILVGDKDKQ